MHHHYIDRYAYRDSPIHRLDPRAKVLAVLAYSIALISVGRHELPSPWLVLFPAVLLLWGGIPLGFVLRQIAYTSPFVLSLVLLSPVFDRAPVRLTESTTMAGGWITAVSVLLRFAMGMAALIGLASTTPFPRLLRGIELLGVPRLLVTQLRFLYRYLFLLIDQVMHLKLARRARDAGRGPRGWRWRAAAGMIGTLFIRTLETAEQVHRAMLARGYDGTIRLLRPLRWRGADSAFVAVALGYAAVLLYLETRARA